MRRRPYPRYKPSSIDWLGDLPEHWRVKRLKALASYRVSNVDKVPSEEEIPVRLCNYTDVYYNELIRLDMAFMEGTATFDEISRFALRKNDVLITKDSEEWSDIAVPALVEETAPDIVCGYHLAIVRPIPSKLHGAFLLRLLQSPAVNQQFQLAATGVTRYGLPKGAIGNAWLPVPPLDEQMAIADFLSVPLSKIEILVQRKHAIIEKLREKRSALISSVVTCGLPPEAARAAGLNPHPELKPSGVEWIGYVPEHWSIRQLKRAIMFQRGHDLPADERTDGHFPVVSSSGISASHIEGCAKGPGIVTGRYGTIGHFYLIWNDYWPLNTTLYSINIHQNDIRFLRYMLIHLAPLFMLEAVKSAVPGVDRNDIHPITTAIPNLREQEAIVNYLDVETAKIERMIEKVEEVIERLQEYRTALITAAVTGKIDLREPISVSRPELSVAAG
jgi:type I restriction enzyme S subunit